MSRLLRSVELGGLVLLCALAGVATTRLIEGWWEPAVALLVAIAGVACAAALDHLLLRRAAYPAVVARLVRVLSVVVGAVLVALIATVAVRQITGKNGQDTALAATIDALVHGWSSIVSAPTPSSAAPRLVVPIAVAVWCTAAAAALLALRPHRAQTHHSAGPLLPCLALLAAACVAAGAAQPSGLIVGGLALTTSGAVLIARTAVRHEPSGSEGSTRGGSFRIGATLVGVALVGGIAAGPTIALGRDAAPFDPRDRLEPPIVDATAKNPLDVVALARRQPDAVLFTVESTAPVPIRIASLDRFDGARWNSSGEFERAGVTFEQPATGALGRPVTAEFWLAGLPSPWLPTIDQPNSLRGADVLVDQASLSFVAPVDAPPDLNYVVSAALPRLDVEVLRNGLPVARDGAALQALQLPPELPARMRDLARGIAEGAPSAFDEALLINAHLASTLRVETERPGGHSFGHIADALFETGIVNDEQLATAFALLARSVGLPTRVAVGVDPSLIDDAGTFDITGADLRVWPEVRFDDFGWVAFRLDVDRFEGGGGILVGLDDTTTATPPRVFDTDDAPASVIEVSEPQPSASPDAPIEAAETDLADTPGAGREPFNPSEGLGRLAIAAIVGTVLALLLAIVTIGLKRRRTAQRRGHAEPRAAVIGAWDDVLERLREAEPDTAQLPISTVEEIIEAHRASGSAITAMYRPVSRALYDDRSISRDDVDQVWQARDRFVASLNERSTLRCRVQRAIDPRVLRPAARSARHRNATGSDNMTGSSSKMTDSDHGGHS